MRPRMRALLRWLGERDGDLDLSSPAVSAPRARTRWSVCKWLLRRCAAIQRKSRGHAHSCPALKGEVCRSCQTRPFACCVAASLSAGARMQLLRLRNPYSIPAPMRNHKARELHSLRRRRRFTFQCARGPFVAGASIAEINQMSACGGESGLPWRARGRVPGRVRRRVASRRGVR